MILLSSLVARREIILGFLHKIKSVNNLKNNMSTVHTHCFITHCLVRREIMKEACILLCCQVEKAKNCDIGSRI